MVFGLYKVREAGFQAGLPHFMYALDGHAIEHSWKSVTFAFCRNNSEMRIKDCIAWLWNASRGNHLHILCVGVTGMVRVAVSLFFIWVCKGLIDNVTGQSEGWSLGVLVAMMIVSMAVRPLLSLMADRLARKTEACMNNELRMNIFDHLMASRWDSRESRHSGDILNRLIDDVPSVSEVLCRGIPSVMITTCQLIGALYILSKMDVRLALILLFIMPAALLLSKSYVSRMRKLTHDIRSRESAIQEHIQESVQNRLLLRSMEYTPYSVSKLGDMQSGLFHNVMRYTNFALFSRLMIQVGFSAGYATAFLWGIFGIRSGAVTFGTMTAFLQLVAQIQNPMVELSRQIPAFIRVMTAAERLAELSDAPLEQTGKPVVLTGRAGIRIGHLTYSYPGGEKKVFDDFSHDFTPGSLTAVIGETGIGKTTLMRLILALVSPDSGNVVFYDCEGNKAEASPLTRRNLSYVPQGNTLFSGTIRDNLRMGNPDAGDEEYSRALHLAAADFVMDLPDGLDTRCGEHGVGLSEGQAQRIAIARGLLRPGGILLLDEPSSSLDIETEKTLLERLSGQVQDKTLIIITHREEIASICTSVLRITPSSLK